MVRSEARPLASDSDAVAMGHLLAGYFAREVKREILEFEEAGDARRSKATKKVKAAVVKRLTDYEVLTDHRPSYEQWWHELAKLYAADRDAWSAEWVRIMDKASAEIESGHRAAEVIAGQHDFGPMDRARFMAVRQALRDEWVPRPGSESFLIDTLAQINTMSEYWTERHMSAVFGRSMSFRVEKDSAGDGSWLPERLDESQALEFSLGMVDRLQRMYLRTLRALRDLRRMAPQVFVQHAGQVNVGEQQVNLAQA